MGLRFNRRISLGSFARINLSKSGASLSAGERGAHLTLGKTPRITLGLPGTGLSWTQTMPHGRSRSAGGVLAFVVRGVALLLAGFIALTFWAAVIAYYGG